MVKSQSIKLIDLLVNTENYRFEPMSSQKDAIEEMVDNQQEKLVVLGQSIIEHGLNPGEALFVSPSSYEKDKYTVLEGNRRTVALKLIHNPDLLDAEKHSSLKKKFKKLHDTAKVKITEMDCIVFDNPAEADIWIKLKHAGESEGAGTVRWNSQQTQRFEEKVEGKSSIALQAIKLLQHSSEVPPEIKGKLKDIAITNLDRLLSDSDVKEFLGISANKGVLESEVPEKEVVKGLTQIVEDITSPAFSVRKIYTKKDRQNYLKGFSKKSTPDTTKKAPKPWQFTVASSSGKSSKPKRKSTDRRSLIPKSCSVSIKNTRVNKIYYELMSIDVHKYTNAVAVLMRVFIELSIDSYIEANGLTQHPSSARSGTDFQQKIFQVASHLENTKIVDSNFSKGIKTSVKDSNSILGLDTWHAYVHNNKFSPIAKNLIITWDNIQPFIEKLWENVK